MATVLKLVLGLFIICNMSNAEPESKEYRSIIGESTVEVAKILGEPEEKLTYDSQTFDPNASKETQELQKNSIKHEVWIYEYYKIIFNLNDNVLEVRLLVK